MNTDRFRDRLLEERQRVVDAIEYLHRENAGSLADEEEVGAYDNHPGDVATITLDREMDYSLEDNASAVLAAIDAALGRIDDGSYGRCVRCGKPIGEERLEARPWATLCIDDKRREEQG
jgi:RNA polymerase-binding protein DksA